MFIDLKPFCAAKDVRGFLGAPWREDGKVVASDGRIMVIVDEMPGEFPGPDSRVGAGRWRQLAAQFEAQFTDPADRMWYSLADLPVPPNAPCPSCDGAGYHWSRPCPDCDGEGSFTHGRHEYDCRECDGTRFVEHTPGNAVTGTEAPVHDQAQKTECIACGGSGIRFDVAEVGRLKFQVLYLNLLKALPECEMTIPTTVEGGMASFRFPGGLGYLMAVR